MIREFIPVTDKEVKIDEMRNFVDLTDSEELIRKIYDNSITPPQSLADLDSEDTFTSQLTVDAALALKIPIGSVEGKYSRKIFIQEYLKYKDITEGEQKVRWGVGVRWIVNIQTIDAKADLSTLPLVAASAQLGYVSAEARFQVLGMSSRAISKAVPAPKILTVDSYAEMNEALVTIKNLIWDEGTSIQPKMLSVLGKIKEPTENRYEEALAVGWALSKIKERKTIREALDQVEGESELFKETVRAVYLDIAKTTEWHREPDGEAVARAKRMLMGLTVKD